MIKDIKYSGYSAVPSDYECPDGELALSLNLINEKGSICSIQQPFVEMELPESEQNSRIVFIHETTAFTHYIFLDENTNVLSWRYNRPR